MSAEMEAFQAQIATMQTQMTAMQSRIGELESQLEKLQKQTLNMQANGNPAEAPVLVCRRLNVVDKEGKTLISLNAASGGATIKMSNSEGEKCLQLLSGNKTNEITFDRKGRLGLRLGLDEGHGFLETYAAGGVPGAMIKATPSGSVVGVADSKGKTRASLSFYDDMGRVEVFHADNKSCGKLLANAMGGMLFLNPPGEAPCVILNAAKHLSALSLGRASDAKQDDEDNMTGIQLMVGADVSAVNVSAAGEDAYRVNMIAMAGQASMDVKNNKEDEVLSLTGDKDGGNLKLNDKTGALRVSLNNLNDGAALALEHADGRGVLFASDTKSTMLSLNAQEAPRVLLSALSTGGVLGIFDENKENAVVLETDEHGGIVAVSKGKNVQAGMRCLEEGGNLFVQDLEDSTQAVLWARTQGGGLQLNGADGARRIQALADENDGSLIITNDAGAVRVGLGLSEDHGQMVLFSSGGDTAAVVSGSEEGGQMILLDPDGNTLITLPAEKDDEF